MKKVENKYVQWFLFTKKIFLFLNVIPLVLEHMELFLLFNNQNFIHHHSIQCSTFQSITCSATSHHQHQCNKTKEKHMDIIQLLRGPAHHFYMLPKKIPCFFHVSLTLQSSQHALV